jgi:hypothetical protein
MVLPSAALKARIVFRSAIVRQTKTRLPLLGPELRAVGLVARVGSRFGRKHGEIL